MGNKKLSDFKRLKTIRKLIFDAWDGLEAIPVNSLRTIRDKEMLRSFRKASKKLYYRIKKET